jgi:VWFA-related protein
MIINLNLRPALFLLVPFLCAPQISARQYQAPTFPGDGKIHLDVVVTPQSGAPVSGLQQQEFTVLDNNVPRTITSFEAVDGRHASLEIVLLIDAVNLGFPQVAVAREGINGFLKADEGRLGYPTAIAILTDKGLQFQEDFSQDGNAIKTSLNHHTIPLRRIYNTTERSQMTLRGLGQLVTREGPRPGRKIIIWVAPGGVPLFGAWQVLDTSEERVFKNIVDLSTQLREARITLYSVGVWRTSWEAYLKEHYLQGVSRPNQAGWENLALGVIAIQSGGLVLSWDNDIASGLQKCVADAGAYYEISFDPANTDRPNEYHHLEIRIAKPGLSARTREGYYSQPWPAEKLAAGPEKLGGVAGTDAALADKSDHSYYANARPYFDLPLAELVEGIPELKALQPAPDERDLPVILEKLGRSVDDFVREIGDLIAHEDVTQEKLDAKGRIQAKERVQGNYLILHHEYELGASSEYRMDEKGNRLGPIGLKKGYVVTAGYALSCIRFSTVAQPQSRFRYLGEEKMDSRETYVLGFAQQPGQATFRTAMKGTGGADVNMLTQGILWVDKNSFQIIRMRSDLLAPRNEIRLDQMTTEVAFGEVQLQDVPNPLWLPSDVDVSMEIDKQRFRNLHHYTDYRRYRVAVKIGTQQ